MEVPLQIGSASAGVLGTAGGVILAASREGFLLGLEAPGRASCCGNIKGTEIRASPISYSVDGTRYWRSRTIRPSGVRSAAGVCIKLFAPSELKDQLLYAVLQSARTRGKVREVPGSGSLPRPTQMTLLGCVARQAVADMFTQSSAGHKDRS